MGGYWEFKVWICSCHMELFFFLHGVTSKRTIYSIKSFKDYIRYLLPKLVIPYFVWGMVYSTTLGIKFWACMLYGSNPTICKVSNGVLWFLPAFVAASVIYACVYGINHRFKLGGMAKIFEIFVFIGFFLAIKNYIPSFGLPFGLNVSFIAIPWMLIGNWSQKFMNEINFRLNRPVKALIGLQLCIFAMIVSQYNIPTTNGVVVTALTDVGNIWFYYVIALIGIVGVILISMALEGVKFLEWMGRGTLVYMAGHYIWIQISLDIIERFSICMNWRTELFYHGFISLLLYTITYWIVLKFIPELGGN